LGAEDTLNHVSFSPDEMLCLGCSSDNKARIWDLRSSKVVNWLTGHLDYVNSGIFIDKNVITGSLDKSIKVWDYHKGYCLRSLFCYSGCTSLAKIDSTIIASGHLDGSLRFWDSKNGDCVKHIVTQSGITDICVSPDGKYLLTNGRDNILSLFEISTFKQLHKLTHKMYQNSSALSRICFSPDGSMIAAGTSSGAVFCWNKTSGDRIGKLTNDYKRPVVSVSWHPDGQMMAYCNHSGWLFFWS